MIEICKGGETYKIHLSEKEEEKINKIIDLLALIDTQIEESKDVKKVPIGERLKILENTVDVLWQSQTKMRKQLRKLEEQETKKTSEEPVRITPDPDLKEEWKLT